VEVDCVEIENRKRIELRVQLFRDAPQHLDGIQAILEGGRRVRDIHVTKLWVEEDEKACLRLMVDRAGDFSPYTLRLVAAKDGRPTSVPPPDFDPRYANVQFSFKAACPSDLDCKTEAACPPEKRDEPEIHYLAKDYSSFRQLILDRLALIMPDWQERHVPDFGLALVEVLAYVGDHLSYYQDTVATEAYLDTAHRRISVRRHARLVDYLMHEGCNARAWVCIELEGLEHYELETQKTWFAAGAGEDRSPASRQMTREEFVRLPQSQSVVFQPLTSAQAIQLFKAHNKLRFYTWGDSLCCLPRGATQATLRYDWKDAATSEDHSKETAQHAHEQCDQPDPHTHGPPPHAEFPLKVGDVLIFEEVKGPKTGVDADADPTRRWAVRLTKVEPGFDPLYQKRIVEIEWAAADALPFPFCLSARLPAPDCSVIEDISVARGNVVLVDHGRPANHDPIGQVPREKQTGECACEGSPVEMTDVPGEFDPKLREGPLTFSQPLPANPRAPASLLLKQDPREALPNIALTGLPGICSAADSTIASELRDRDNVNRDEPRWQWLPQRDLLASNGSDQHFVVEVDNEGRANLRFGDGELGRQPEAGAVFGAFYRVGNGPDGNVGAETITTIVLLERIDGATLRPRNPLAAQGGTAPEPMAEVKLFAPGAFRKVLQRAVIADDYARLAEREFTTEVQRAGGSLRWTGSWYEAQVAVDPRGAEEARRSLLRRVEHRLHRYRRIGHDLDVVTARLVPLKIVMHVCVLPHFLRGHVESALMAVFGTGVMPDGTRGFFHPDNLTFGAGIYVSKLVAVAQAVPGVESVRVTKLERLCEGANQEIENGLLPLGPLEVPQLDSDPSFPEHGRLILKMGGGR
jgi:hypothetical protein